MADSAKETVAQREKSNSRDGERNRIANFNFCLELWCKKKEALLFSPSHANDEIVRFINKKIGNLKKKLDLLEEDDSSSEQSGGPFCDTTRIRPWMTGEINRLRTAIIVMLDFSLCVKQVHLLHCV
jgi:hypothetical protein